MKLKPSVCLTLASALALPAQVLAQTAPARPATPATEDRSNAQVMEAFTVTGSNIRRIDEEKILPVSIIDADELSLRAVSTPAEIFDTLSIGGPITLDEGNSLGADARGDNTAINLRGIGSGNTLVLLNGRRLPPHPISQAESGVPSLSTNINQLPSSAIQRLEVLRDGASAIYGTDAAAGVVNTLTRTRYDGLSLRLRGMVTQHGGANERNVEITHGENFNAGRSNILLTFDYFHRDPLLASQREFSRSPDVRVTRNVPAPWNGVPIVDSTGVTVIDNDFDNRLSGDSSNFGNYVRGAFDASGTFTGTRPTGNRGIVTASGSNNMTTSTAGVFYLIPLADSSVGFRQTLPSHNLDDTTQGWYYNPAAYRPILPKTDRMNLMVSLNHELAGGTTLFSELMGYRAVSITGRQPTATDASVDHNIYVGKDNPYNPFGSRFYSETGANNPDGTPRLVGTPADVLIASSTGVIPSDFKARRITVTTEAYRWVTGLRGKFAHDWDWESAVLYGRNKTRDEEQFAIRESRLRAALRESDPAKAFNPFGYSFKLVPQAGNTTNPYLIQVDRPFSNAEALTASLYDNFVREGTTELASWDAKVSGRAFDFGFLGGELGFATGAELRWESYNDYRPPYAGRNPDTVPFNGNASDPTNLFFGPTEDDFIALSPNVNLASSRTVASAFGEVLVPIVGKRNAFTGVRALDLSVAGRIEKFSDFGRTAKPKFGLGYRPNSWIVARTSVSGSFRAPNLVQTNTTPLQRTSSGISDPYRSDVTGLNVDSNAAPTTFRQGSANLKPESSRSISAGIAVSLPFYRDFTVTVDYWRIKMRDVIDDVTATAQLERDEELLDAATQKALAAGTPISQINLGSGTSSYAGNPKVTRAAVTADDISRYNTFNTGKPATQQRAPVGSVRSVVTDYVNLAGREAEGVDVGFELRLPKKSFGQFTLRGDASYLVTFETEDEPGAARVNNIQRDGRPRVRGSAGVTYRYQRWTAGWFSQYYGSFVDTSASTTAEVYEALGRPDYISNYVDSGGVRRYRYLVTSSINHNAYIDYALPRRRDARVLSNMSIRFGVNNVFDAEPPLADEDYGYRRGAATNPRGRAFYGQLTKRF